MAIKVHYQDLGLIHYDEALNTQESLFHAIIDSKLQGRSLENMPASAFFVCEHHHVLTLGKSGKKENLLFSEAHLKKQGVEFYNSSRGGDITYHGPGQIVGYPVLDLEKFRLSVKSYVNALEEVIILTLDEYGLKGGRMAGMTGVWIDYDHPVKCRKICAMGIRISRYVSMHGFALNVNTDLSYFNFIVPCGLKGKAVTSMQKEIGKDINKEEVKNVLKKNFQEVFDAQLL